MTPDQITDLAREFQGELLCCGVDQHILERMIRRAIQPVPYLEADATGRIVWTSRDMEIDPIDEPLRKFDLRELLRENSDRCTCCRRKLDESTEGPSRVAARVYRDEVRTGILCPSCVALARAETPAGAAAKG